MIIALKVVLMLVVAYFASHGVIDRYRTWTRKKGVRFIIEVIKNNTNIVINGYKERDNLFTSDEEEAILNYLENTNQEIVSLISSEREITKLTKAFVKVREKKKRDEIERILNQNKKDKS